MSPDPLRHHKYEHLSSAFGNDRFGRHAERLARFFGTPKYIVTQTIIVLIWIAANAFLLGQKPFDPYPFILLNLAFSTQAAYAAPLILLAQTRQADRDKATTEAQAEHQEALAQQHCELIEANTALTEEIHKLTKQLVERSR